MTYIRRLRRVKLCDMLAVQEMPVKIMADVEESHHILREKIGG